MVVCCTTVCGQTPFSENPNRIDQSNPQIDPANRQLDPANQQFDPANRQFDPANRQFDSANRQFDPANRQFDPANRQFDQNNPQGPFNNPNTDIYGNVCTFKKLLFLILLTNLHLFSRIPTIPGTILTARPRDLIGGTTRLTNMPRINIPPKLEKRKFSRLSCILA